MEIVRKIPTIKYQVPNPTGDDKKASLVVTPYFINSIEELVKSNRKCVCIHHTLSDYRYETLGTKYNELSLIDVVGTIKSFNQETMEITIEIDDEYFEEGNSRYIDATKIDFYHLFMRSMYSIHHSEDGEPSNNLEAHTDRLIGFDLVYVNEEEREM